MNSMPLMFTMVTDIWIFFDALKIIKDSGFPYYAEPLLVGTFEEAKQYPRTFLTPIPQKYFKLPLMDDNIAEGVVLKPVKNGHFPNGSRLLFKNKSERFSEKAYGIKPLRIKNSKPRELSMEDEPTRLYHEMMSMVTLPRLESVISKVGQVTQKDFSKLMGLYTRDVLAEFNKDQAVAFSQIPKEQRDMITKRLSEESARTVKKYLIDAQQSPNN